MKITKLKTNHITNPLGFALEQPLLSYVVEQSTGSFQKEARILVSVDEDFQEVIYDSGMRTDIDSLGFLLPIEPKPACRYYWKVFAAADDGDAGESETAYFETAKAPETLQGRMIKAKDSHDVDYFTKSFFLEKTVTAARASATALGVYELYINGEKAGIEYLAPGSNDYDSWLQYQTYDITKLLKQGENTITIAVAPGWYSGYFGFAGQNHVYGDEKAALCDVDIRYTDNSGEIICTDESWKAGVGPVRYSEIYHGEVQDWENGGVYSDARQAEFGATVSGETEQIAFDRGKLSPRRSLPVVVKETVKPLGILTTPAGETVLDLGQNMAGWVAFTCREPAGAQLHFQYGEILQNGNFYRENLRSAKAEFTCISDGKERVVRPHFTYYGFRYVKIQGFTQELSLEDFWGEAVYSDMDTIGSLSTSNPLVNRLILNTLWGQKGNFVEVPTDCPQRDERMGWTGDAQVFSGTAAFQMDVFAFFSKYGYDMKKEQEKYEGCVPMVIPSIHMGPGGSSAWGDAATIIPWNLYLHSGDVSILKQQYPSMKMWADYIFRQDEENGGRRLWATGFHFGDWLALDGDDPSLPTGATEPFYVASCYYYLSTLLTAKAGKVLGKPEAAEYFARADQIKAAIQDEYFTKTGRLALTTQTGYVLALAFGICPEKFRQRIAADLHARLEKDNGYLKTGFVGTPYLCQVLSEYGYHEMAFRLLLNEDCPGWLYPVRMGATTIWERWNSVLPDGTINPEGMNSLNHYSYGSVVEWMYRYVAGIRPMPEGPGFREALLSPMPDYRMSKVTCRLDSPAGAYESSWRIEGNRLNYRFVVPFGAKARIVLRDAELSGISCNCEIFIREARQEGNQVVSQVSAGTYEVSYLPTVPYQRRYGIEMKLNELLARPKIREQIFAHIPGLQAVPVEMFGNKSLKELAHDQMCPVSLEEVERMAQVLQEFVIEPDQVMDAGELIPLAALHEEPVLP